MLLPNTGLAEFSLTAIRNRDLAANSYGAGPFPVDPHFGEPSLLVDGSSYQSPVTRVSGLSLGELTSLTGAVFNDVADNSSIYDAVKWMKTVGITNGCGNNNYCPDDNVTRGQMALFLYRMGHGTSAVPVSNGGGDTSEGSGSAGGFDINALLKNKVALAGAGLVLLMLLMGRR